MTAQPIVRFAAGPLGFPLYPKQADILASIYADGIRTAVLRLGRRSGKGRVAAVVGTYEATVNAAAHLRAVPPGEQIAICVISTSQRAARTVHRYAAGFLRRPALASLVIRETADEIELSNGIVLMTLPCNAASARGLAIAVVILDEAAWWAGSDGSPLDAGEAFRALVPATAQFSDSRRVIVASTPRFAGDWFATLCQRAEAGADPETRAFHASTAEMNPSISPAFLAAEQERDPVSFRREYLAEFEASISSALDPDLVRLAVVDRGDLPPVPEVEYRMAVDPAYTGDRFALVLGHRDADSRVIVDRVTSWAGSKAHPVQIDKTLDEIAAISQAYGGARVLIDQYSAQAILQGLRSRGIRAEERPWTSESKASALASVRRCLYAGRLELPSNARLVGELVSLEQRAGPSGRPVIRAARGGHDDAATATMMLVDALSADTPAAAGATIEPTPAASRLLGDDKPEWLRRRWSRGAGPGARDAGRAGSEVA